MQRSFADRPVDDDVDDDVASADQHPVLAAAWHAVGLVGDPAVEQSWWNASALVGFRVGGLAAHLVRAIETIRQYTESESPPPDAVLVDAVGYYAAVLGNHDPATSDLHAGIRERGESRVDEGHRAVVEAATSALSWLDEQHLDLNRPVSVFDGTAVRLGDYLDSRLVELIIHSDDLAVSVGIETPHFDDEAWQIIARVQCGTALRRHHPREIAIASARPERARRVGAFDAVARP
jgi:hypothetical protein